jgi:transcriptional regulator with XRE-family HTH domain
VTGETFGQLLRRLRIERGFSQNALARMSGVDPAYVNRMERDDGSMSPRKPIMLALAEALDLSYAERDRLLWAAGLAPEVDWQRRCEDVEAALESVKAAVAVLETVRAAVVDLETIEEPPFIRRRTG